MSSGLPITRRPAPDPPSILVTGINHRTCPIDIRESRFERVTYERFRTARPLDDLVILKTCNRVECYATSSDRRAARSALHEALDVPSGTGFLYDLEGMDAVVHLLRVAAGLDSMALGEQQIEDQVRRAPDGRPKRWGTGPLAGIFRRAARLAPRFRRMAGIQGPPVSMSDAAVGYIREVVRIPNARVTLLGTGKMGRLAAAALPADAIVTVVNRDYERAKETARNLGSQAAKISEIGRLIGRTDVLIASTSAQHRVVTARTIAQARRPSGRPLWIIDLGLPRNVEPIAAKLPGVRIVTIDDLGPWAGTQPDPASRARVDAATRTQAEHLLGSVLPRAEDHVAALRRSAEQIRKSEVRVALARMPDATPGERAVLEKMSSRLVNRLLHSPTQLARRVRTEGREVSLRERFETRPTSEERR